MDKVVVAGAGFGGIRAAIDLHRQGFDVEVVDKNFEHVYTPGLIDLVRQRVNTEDLTLDVNELFSSTTIQTLEATITGFNPDKNVVELEEGVLNYDYLVLALGSTTKSEFESDKIITPYTIDSALKLSEIDGSVCIVGSGYTGIEYAAELEAKGVETHIFDSATRPLPGFSEDISLKVLDYLNKYDIGFTGGKKVDIMGNGSVSFEGRNKKFDKIIWCGGVQPVAAVRESFGDEGLKVNKGLCSVEFDNIFAIGACNSLDGNSAHQSLKEAELIAENISKEDFKDLKMIDDNPQTFLVSLGRTGLFVHGEQHRKNFLFRYVKDIVRKTYIWNLKKEKFLLNNLM